MTVLLFLSGWLIGFDTRTGLGNPLMSFVFYLSTLFAIAVFFSYALLMQRWLQHEWQWVVVRSLGGWLFAVGLMMLAFAFLPDGQVLVTERFGTLKKVDPGTQIVTAITGIPSVFSGGQGGLMDITVHPNFTDNNWIYLSYAHGTQEANRLRVARANLVENRLENTEVIFEVAQTKSGGQHFGSRFLWLPDNTLLFSVGDGGNPPTQYNGELIREQAQYLNAHLGKLIRINDDGSIPENNPFVGRPDVLPEIWSYGHRNVQGLAYDTDSNQVYVSEHGSKGGDELNPARAGENYGWPLTTYSTEYDFGGTAIAESNILAGTINPTAVWTPSIAPSSLVYYDGNQYETGTEQNLFLAAMLLRANTSIMAYATNPAGAILRLIKDEAGHFSAQEKINVGAYRIRSLAQGPDGYLYVLTDSPSPQSRSGNNAGGLWRLDSF